jgi:transcriptional regulator with XRE-family HTH domain
MARSLGATSAVSLKRTEMGSPGLLEDPPLRLSRRLRELRKEAWTGVTITQAQLASTLGVSGPSVSSWESPSNPKPPPEDRLVAYAAFFATARSADGGRLQLIDTGELTREERARKDELEAELLALRAAVVGADDRHNYRDAPYAGRADRIGGGPWHFPDLRPVTIVCAPLPPEMRELMPYTDPRDPDYIELYTYADLDALVELHGHIRAVNPNSEVRIGVASELDTDDYTTHLVLLGGVDWNVLTRDVLDSLPLPVAQVARDDNPHGAFEISDGGRRRSFGPVLRQEGDRNTLLEDVAHFFRGPSPYNRKRTLTICNGMFGRGTYGAVRTLTDARFRDRNADYVRSRFPDSDTFSILSRVHVVGGKVLTPDWTVAEARLHEWPEAE